MSGCGIAEDGGFFALPSAQLRMTKNGVAFKMTKRRIEKGKRYAKSF